MQKDNNAYPMLVCKIREAPNWLNKDIYVLIKYKPMDGGTGGGMPGIGGLLRVKPMMIRNDIQYS